MLYEWYRGSDSSKRVPSELARLERAGDSLTSEQKVADLRGLLEIEQEPNFRGYLLWWIGREYLEKGKEGEEEAVAVLLDAENVFDPLLGTINDLVAPYCDTLYRLILHHYYDRKEMVKVASLASTIVANLDEARLSDFERSMVFFYQGFAFEMLAKRHSLGWLHPVALASYLKWHHLAPEEPAGLEHLAYSYFYVGDVERSALTAKMCLEVAPEGEIRDRVEGFLRDHARDLCGRKH